MSYNEAYTALIGHPYWIFSVKFGTSDLNLGINDPCCNWSTMRLFEEVFPYNEEATALKGKSY